MLDRREGGGSEPAPRAAGEFPPWAARPRGRPGRARGTLITAPGPGPRHGAGEASREGLRRPAPVCARRRAAARPAAVCGAAALRVPTPGPQRPAGPGSPAAGAAPAARAWPAPRRQQEAGDLRAQRAPRASGGRRERDAGAGLLRPARASPPEGQLQTVHSWA